MKISIIGTGYVGLPTGVGFAELGNQVTCIDINQDKINQLNDGQITLYEEGLEEIFIKNLSNGQIKFTSSYEIGLKDSDFVMLAVGTPPHPETNEADLKYVYAAAKSIAPYLNKYTVIATKSTVPIGTGDEIEKIIKDINPSAEFDVVSLPEFLREGFAVYDFFNPDRIIVGSNSEKASAIVKKLYLPFDGKTQLQFVSRKSSETIKYASNAFLAMKIQYINEMANFCEKSGADISEVAHGMGLDTRIGNKFLNPGPGYGGSCFPKDTLAMVQMGEKFNVDLSLIKSTIKGNLDRKKEMAIRICNSLKELEKPIITVFGLTFKSGTDDCRESPAVEIIQEVLSLNSKIRITAFDPKGIENAKHILGDQIEYSLDMYQACQNSDALVLLTEWDEFKTLNIAEIKTLMKGNKLIDFRGLINPTDARNLNFDYYCIGKK